MNYWKHSGAPAEKLIVGFPEYGHTFTLSNPSDTGIGAPTSGDGPSGPYTRQAGFWAYYEVSRLAVSAVSGSGSELCSCLGSGVRMVDLAQSEYSF